MSKLKLSRIAVATSVTLCALGAAAQTQSPVIGNGGGTIDQQIIGDTTATADRTQSTSNQLGNSANNNGASMANTVDTRDQNTVHSAGGAANSIGNQSDNRSSASNGPQTMGQANTGNSAIGNTTSSSGGNILGGATSNSGGNTTTSAGGAGGAGGQGGAASTVGINGQQQGIAGSGNSDSRNTLTGGATTATGGAQAQQQANRSTNSLGQSTVAGNGAGAGAGSGNRTSNTTATSLQVDAADRSVTNYRSTAWAPVIHGPAAPALAAANVVMFPGVCGPRHELRMVPVMTTHRGVIWDSEKQQGNDYSAVPAEMPFIERNGYLMGHQVIEYTAVLGTSSGGSFSLGGFGKDGQAAQGGAASNGQVQQIVQRVSLRECVFAERKIAEAPVIRPVTLPLPLPRADRN